MKVAETPFHLFRARLSSEGVAMRVGPYILRINSNANPIAWGLYVVGAHYCIIDPVGFVDFDLKLTSQRSVRPPFAPHLELTINGRARFASVPLSQAYAALEWGLNWCIAFHSDRFLLIHSAVVEKDGKALLLPAPPGSGKSTLCAALVLRGWRLLSDELTILDKAGNLIPVPRPISLKNSSIEIMRQFDPSATIGGESTQTSKGTVAYLRPPADSVDRQLTHAIPGWIAFPKYESGAAPALTTYSKAETLIYLAANSFNYHIHGVRGFELLADVVDRCDCFSLRYGSLKDALDCVETLVAPRTPAALGAA